MSFDYSAPAELFLAKPMKGSRTKYRRFATAAEAIRYAVEDLRTPELSELGCRWGMSASIVLKSNACTKMVSIRCGNQRVTKRTRRYRIGSPLQSKLRISTPTP